MISPGRFFTQNIRLRAFSLVEVTMALGIAAFAFTALLGMLPIGLNLFRTATDSSVTTRIVQKISGDLQQTDFDSLSQSGNQTFYFDEQGTTRKSKDNAIYWAQVQIVPTTKLPGASSQPSSDLARVVIQVARNPNGTAFSQASDGTWKEENGVKFIKRSFFVARNTPKSQDG